MKKFNQVNFSSIWIGYEKIVLIMIEYISNLINNINCIGAEMYLSNN